MVRRKSSNKTVMLACMLVFLVVALLVLKGDVHLLRLSIVSVPQEGVAYDFNDGTFQDWTVTSPYVTVENGIVKAGAPGSGSRDTSIFTYNFNSDFEGWEKYTWDSSDSVVASSKYLKMDSKAVKFYVHGHVTTYGGHGFTNCWNRKE